MAFHPYLNFGGNCREAFDHYQEIFGGELYVMGTADAPPEAEIPEGAPDSVLHAALMFDGHLLMASDVQPGTEFGPVQGMYVNYSAPDIATAERVWAELRDGAREVEMELGEAFFSPRFGVCTDRFGTPWMITVETERPSG